MAEETFQMPDGYRFLLGHRNNMMFTILDTSNGIENSTKLTPSSHYN